jgi:hypothetical protein
MVVAVGVVVSDSGMVVSVSGMVVPVSGMVVAVGVEVAVGIDLPLARPRCA